MGEALRKRRHGTGRRSGQSWYTDETYLKVQGRWCYLYRAIDRDGNLIDTMLSATRDMRAAQRFFRSARSVAGFVPDRVTTDGHNSYPRAIRSTLGRRVRHRTSVYLNNRLEQDHRGIKGRIRCMRGFKEHSAAGRFCREHDELRNFLRSRSRHNQHVPATRRLRHARIAIARHAGRMISKTQAARRTANGTRRDRTPARAHTPSVAGRPRPLPSTRVRAARSSVSPSKCKLRCSTATSAAMNGLTSRWSVRLSTKSLAPPRCAGQSSALCCSLRLSQCHLHNATHRADTLAE